MPRGDSKKEEKTDRRETEEDRRERERDKGRICGRKKL